MPSVLSKSSNLLVSTQAFVKFSDTDAQGAINNGTVVGNSKADGKTRYKVLGLSEGIHNGLRVLREDIKQMANDVSASTETIPVVLDHSFAWNDVVGKILGVTYYDTFVAPDGKQLNGALLMDIELLPPSDTTPKLNETLYRLEQLPELAKFSVAFKFTPITDEKGNITVHDLVLKHLAIVTNPADSSTQILEKLSKRENVEYMLFDMNDMENTIYRGTKMPTARKATKNTARYAARRNARFNNARVEAIARNPLTKGTYPIRDVKSITMRPGELSPLGCECGEELYQHQLNERKAEFAKRRAARFHKRGNARFNKRGTARFTQYGVPTIYGNPWDYPVSDTYPNVNQLIALRKKQAQLRKRAAALGRRAKLLEQREGKAKFARRNARFARRGARFDDEIVPVMEEPIFVDEPIMEAPVFDEIGAFEPVVEEVAPITSFEVPYDVPENTASVGNVSEYVSDDIIPTVDPVIQAYVEEGLITPEEVEIVEVALAQHRKAKFAARRARFARKANARRGAKFSGRRATRGAKFAGRRASRNGKFEGLINEYLVPSANLPRKYNVNIREDKAEFARKRAARFGAKAPRRSGSFFVKGGVKRENKDETVPVQNTSIAPVNSANSAPTTFVGKQSTKELLKELNETKQKLAESEKLSILRSEALSMQFADKDLIMTFSEDQLKKYITSKGTEMASFAGQMNPFVGKEQKNMQIGNYVAEFADSFTKGNYNTVCTIDQISQTAESKAAKLFGGN